LIFHLILVLVPDKVKYIAVIVDEVEVLENMRKLSGYYKFLLNNDLIFNPSSHHVYNGYLMLVAVQEQIKVTADIEGPIELIAYDMYICWIRSDSLDDLIIFSVPVTYRFHALYACFYIDHVFIVYLVSIKILVPLHVLNIHLDELLNDLYFAILLSQMLGFFEGKKHFLDGFHRFVMKILILIPKCHLNLQFIIKLDFCKLNINCNVVFGNQFNPLNHGLDDFEIGTDTSLKLINYKLLGDSIEK
jgi:hypothetical protein